MDKLRCALASLTLATVLSAACSDQSTQQSNNDSGAPGGDASGGPADLASGGDIGPPISCSGYIYCENFEAYNGAVMTKVKLGPWTPTVTGTGNTAVVDGVKPYSGSRALHITVPASARTQNSLNQAMPSGLIPGNNLFGRAMFVYSNAGTDGLPVNSHSWFFNAAGNAAVGPVSMNLGTAGLPHQYQFNYQYAPPPGGPGGEDRLRGGTPNTGAWHCLQWNYDGSGTPSKNHARLWVDGTLLVDAMAPNQNWPAATPWTSFDFGFTYYEPVTNPVEVFLDDFALNDTMIPCPP